MKTSMDGPKVVISFFGKEAVAENNRIYKVELPLEEFVEIIDKNIATSCKKWLHGQSSWVIVAMPSDKAEEVTA